MLSAFLSTPRYFLFPQQTKLCPCVCVGQEKEGKSAISILMPKKSKMVTDYISVAQLVRAFASHHPGLNRRVRSRERPRDRDSAGIDHFFAFLRPFLSLPPPTTALKTHELNAQGFGGERGQERARAAQKVFSFFCFSTPLFLSISPPNTAL